MKPQNEGSLWCAFMKSRTSRDGAEVINIDYGVT